MGGSGAWLLSDSGADGNIANGNVANGSSAHREDKEDGKAGAFWENFCPCLVD